MASRLSGPWHGVSTGVLEIVLSSLSCLQVQTLACTYPLLEKGLSEEHVPYVKWAEIPASEDEWSN
jgi:hypothetical protein